MPFANGNRLQQIGNQARVLENRLKRILAEDGYAAFDRACRAQIRKAEAGDLAAAEFLFNRVDGKVRSDDQPGEGARSLTLDELVLTIMRARAHAADEAIDVSANTERESFSTEPAPLPAPKSDGGV